MEKEIAILKIIGVQYVNEYKLLLTFNDGKVRLCDFEPLFRKGICTKLQNMEYFKNFRLDPFSVDWNNEIGFAPEFLYENSVEVK
ncbi:MAG: DUF2442 domain-containing protein [Bacteroidales bacterium]|nr:DUF2442 domain-containing protein [Bacteroidales bacterium]